MEHESPIMKAWREFALADPEDCEREYDAYITLVNRKAAVSGSSPTNSTSSLHHRTPAAAVTAPSTTRSTAPLSAPSNAMSSTAVSEESASRWDQDDVYPPLAELRRALMTDAEWAAMSEWEKDLWEMKHLPEEERMKSIEGVVMWLPAAQQDQRRKEILEEILRFGEPAPTLSSSRAPASTTDTSLVLPVAIELDVVQDAVDDQAAPTPTNCSSECPSKDAYTSVSVSISSATPNSSTTTGGIVPELAAPELSDKELDVDVMGDTVPLAAICLPGGPDRSTGGEDTMSMSLTLWSASTSFTALPGNSTSPWLAPLDVVQPFMWSPITCSTIHSSCCIDTPPSLLVEQHKVFNVVTTGTAIVPWPPHSLTRAKPPLIHGHDLFQHEQQKHANEFSVKDSKGSWSEIWLDVELKPPWPSLGVCMNLPMANEIHLSSWPWVTTPMNVGSHWEASLNLFCVVQGYPSSNGFPAILNGEAVVHQSSTCRAGDESVYSSESFQWTIAWPLSYHFSLSVLQTRPHCAILLIYKNCPATNQEIWFRLMIAKLISAAVLVRFLENCSEADMELCMLNYAQPYSSECSQWEIAWLVGWSSGAQADFACSGIVTIMFWLNFKLGVLPPLCCRDLTFWRYPSVDPMMPNSACIFQCGFELTQWKIAWSKEQNMNLLTRNYREGFLVVLSMASNALVLIIGCKNRSMGCSAWTEDTVPTQLLEVYNMLSRQERNIIPLKLFVIENWLIPWEPGNDSSGHNLMENFTSLAITCELLYSVSVDGSLLADRYLLWCIRCVQVDTDGSRNCVSFLQPKPPWLLLTPTSYASGVKSYHRIVSESMLVWSLSWPFSLSISWLLPCSLWKYWLLPCSTQRVFLSSSGKWQLKIAGSLDLVLTEWNPWTSGVYFWSSYLGASVCGSDVPILLWLKFALQHSLASQEEFHFSIKIGKLHDILVELGVYTRSIHYLEVCILDATFTRSHTLHAAKLLLGLHYSCDQFVAEGATYFDSQYFEWQIPWYNCDREFLEAPLSAHPPSKALHLPWDPGDCFASAGSRDNFCRVDDGSSFPLLDTSQVPWDPGGVSGDRLGGKPKFKKGGLSTTSLLGWSVGRHSWANACTGATRGRNR